MKQSASLTGELVKSTGKSVLRSRGRGGTPRPLLMSTGAPLRSAFPGVREAVAAAKAAGMGLGVASSGAPQKIRRNLQSSGEPPRRLKP